MNVLGIIPARGGSKGIPHKNLIPLLGKPLVGLTIEAARQARLLTRVVVSTDDEEIARVAQQFGAEVVKRPAELSGDTASSESALLHVLEHLAKSESYQPDLTVFLQCTSPLTSSEDIDGVIECLQQNNADAAFAVTPFHYFLWRRDSSGQALGINHDPSCRPLRQNREPQFLETGAVYVMRTEGFLRSRHRFFGKVVPYVMPRERCIEIDEPADLSIAEALLREQKLERTSLLPKKIRAVIFDFDGVFTDNSVLVFENGLEAVKCNRSDGWGLSQLKRLGMPLLVLSLERNPVVRARCDKLEIDCKHGVQDKLPAMLAWLAERAINTADVVYVGNDTNDLSCLKAVGCGVAVADAHPEARAAARIVLSATGGNGAVRELTDMILRAEGRNSDARNC